MGMLRNIIVVGAAIAFMPSPPPNELGTDSTQTVSSFAYVAAAAETVADMRSFCQRNPNVCSTASAVAVTMEGKAKYSAKLIYEWANEATSESQPMGMPENTAEIDRIQTGAPPAKPLQIAEGQNTLTLADVIEPWQKPKGIHRKG